jgi:hypothetical protein
VTRSAPRARPEYLARRGPGFRLVYPIPIRRNSLVATDANAIPSAIWSGRLSQPSPKLLPFRRHIIG